MLRRVPEKDKILLILLDSMENTPQLLPSVFPKIISFNYLIIAYPIGDNKSEAYSENTQVKYRSKHWLFYARFSGTS